MSSVCHTETATLLYIYHANPYNLVVYLSKHMNINSLQSNQKDS
jgi:hypothetical protein